MGSIFFFLLINGVRSNFYFYMIFYFYFIAVLGFCSLFLLVATRFCSVFTRLKLYYIRNFDASVQFFWLSQQLKKRNETTQNNKNPHHRNILTEALDENINKWKNLFVPSFSRCFPILHLIAWESDSLLNCRKNLKFYGLQRSKE